MNLLVMGLAVPVAIALLVAIVLLSMMFRVVVKTNEVHIVQRKNSTVPYGRGLENGNVYYKWPAWVPRIGVSTIVLPTSIFDIDLRDYDAYDIGRLPFMVDIKAFFQVEKPEDAAQRVQDFVSLKSQLTDILKGCVRKILATSDIEEIMGGRSKFSQEFTKEVEEQLSAWGVSTVKNIEFMDIRDSNGSKVIDNIMAKKKSLIERDSRIEVASNKQQAAQAEIDAQREVDIQAQLAARQVGEKTAEKDKMVGIANQLAEQEIKEQEKVTAEKQMAVLRVQQEQAAAINKNVAIIDAEKEKEQKRLAAEAELIQQQRIAEGILVRQQKEAEGTLAIGASKAEAERLLQMAPVTAQITLAKEIGQNTGYQKYLVQIKALDVEQVVGIEKAKALAEADLKIISNAGDIQGGVNGLMDILSPKGGTSIGGMLEGLAQTAAGKALLDKFSSVPTA